MTYVSVYSDDTFNCHVTFEYYSVLGGSIPRAGVCMDKSPKKKCANIVKKGRCSKKKASQFRSYAENGHGVSRGVTTVWQIELAFAE